MDFSSGKSFDDHHRPTTLGAEPKIARVVGARRNWLGRRSCSRAEQLRAKWQGSGTFAIGQEAEVPDAHEAIRKQVQLDWASFR